MSRTYLVLALMLIPSGIALGEGSSPSAPTQTPLIAKGAIKGSVVSPVTTALPPIEVKLKSTSGKEKLAITDRQGNYSFADLENGEYTLAVVGGDGNLIPREPLKVKVGRGQLVATPLEVPPLAAVKLAIKDSKGKQIKQGQSFYIEGLGESEDGKLLLPVGTRTIRVKQSSVCGDIEQQIIVKPTSAEGIQNITITCTQPK